MTGQYTPIISIDYNSLQSKISQIFGVGSGDYGYGQDLASKQISPRSIITRTQWNNLRTDLIKARQHQTGIDQSNNLPYIPLPDNAHGILPTKFTSHDAQLFANFILAIESDRLVTPPSSQATRENLVVGTRTTPWNNVVTHTVTVQFTSEEAARWYFNTGSTLEFSASRTGGTSNSKNSSWSTLLSTMGTITFGRQSTTSSGSGTGSLYGYYNLTSTNTLIFRKTEIAGTYNANNYAIYAKIGADRSTLIYTINISDSATTYTDENIDGTLTSTVQVFRSSGSNVSVNRPAASSQMTGTALDGGVIITPPPPVPSPNYVITRDLESIGEGSTEVIFTVTTQNVPNGTVLYWTTSTSSGITAADFTDDTLTGTILIVSNTATIVRTAIKDQKTEGVETFFIELRSTSLGGPIVAVSQPVDIVDLSTDPIPEGATYTITPSATILVEGASEGVVFTVNTTGVPSGTTLFWTTVSSDNVTASDFSDNTLIGTVTIKNNVGTFKRVTRADLSTEGSEKFAMELRTVSSTGTVVATSQQLLILDISLTPSFSLTATPSPVDEGGIITVEMVTNNVQPSTKLYLTMAGTLSDTDISQLSGPTIDPLTKEFTFSASPTVWTYQVFADLTTEGTENATWQVRTSSKTSTAVAESNTVIVVDTSKQAGYGLVVTPLEVNEGSNITTTLNVSNVAIGTTLYLKLNPSSQATYEDLMYVSGPTISPDQSFVTTANPMVWSHTILADQKTEGTETFNWTITTDAAFTKVVAASDPVTKINDTSISLPEYNIVAFPINAVEGEVVTGATTLSIMDSPVENLVAYWNMDEGTGTTLNDKVDNSYQIAKGGSFGWVTINGVTAASFTGTSSSFAQVSQDTEKMRLTAKAGSSYTIEAWIYPTGPGQNSTYGGEIINHDNDFEISRMPDGRIIVASDWGIGTDVNLPGGGWIGAGGSGGLSTAIAPQGQATHIAVVIENTVLRIYINGSLAWSKSGLNRLASSHTGKKTFIGNRTTKASGFQGHICNLRIWNIARTAEQIQTWYTTMAYPGIQSNPDIISSAGNSIAFNITSKNVTNGTVVYWTTEGTEPGLNSSDFTDGAIEGTVEINDNKALITRKLTADVTTEGLEHFKIAIFSDDQYTTRLATSQLVTIEDTSVRANGAVEYIRPGPTAYAPYVVPSGVTKLTIEMVGGGGSGGYSYRKLPQASGGGGGAGGFLTRTIDVTPGQQIKVNVGAGGVPTFNEEEYARNGATTSLVIGTTIGDVTYSGTPYNPASHPAWTNSLMKSHAVWMAGLYQRNIMRWDLYLTTSGSYTIAAAADDVMTMWIDGVKIFNAPVSGFNKTTQTIKTLTAGLHTIIISGKDTKGTVAGVAATISKGSTVVWHTRMGPNATISEGTIHVSGGTQGNDGMVVEGIASAGRGGLRGYPAGQDGTNGEIVANNVNAHPGLSQKGTAWGGDGGTSHYGAGGTGGKGTAGLAGQSYGAGGGGGGAVQKLSSTAKVSLGGAGRDGYIKISWGQSS